MFNKINWKSSIQKKNRTDLHHLQDRLVNFYSSSKDYYHEIDFTNDYWKNKDHLPFQEILNQAETTNRILEVGCGSANILKYHPELSQKYHGIDFSPDLIETNQRKYPTARFKNILNPQIFPFEDQQFDFVFSVYVLEHCVFPNIFLDECYRVLKPSGKLIILTPDFLARSRMTSQKVGFSAGSGRDKFSKGKWIDGIVTMIENRVILPLYSRILRYKASRQPKFMVNLNPVCFSQQFYPDADAVYVTYEREIKTYLNEKFEWHENTKVMSSFLKYKKLIMIQGVRK